MSGMVVIANGAQVDPQQPVLSATDPGLTGQGVYEALRTYDGHVFALSEHLHRLEQGADRLAVPCDTDALRADLALAIRLRGAGESRLRIILTAAATRIVIAEPLPDRRSDRERGVTAVTLPWRRDPAAPTTGIKATSTAAVRVANRWVADHGAATGIWLTPRGLVVEALSANIFCFDADTLLTPPVRDGALTGVTRHLLLRYAAEAGFTTREASITRGRLARAAEVFLTATSEPVVAVVGLDGSAIGAGTPGPVTRRLQAVFDDAARASVSGAERR